jgi:hypothetical protein
MVALVVLSVDKTPGLAIKLRRQQSHAVFRAQSLGNTEKMLKKSQLR